MSNTTDPSKQEPDSLQNVDVRAGRTQTVKEEWWWEVQVLCQTSSDGKTFDGEKWECAVATCDEETVKVGLRPRGDTRPKRVVRVEVVERREVVQEPDASSHIESSSATGADEKGGS